MHVLKGRTTKTHLLIICLLLRLIRENLIGPTTFTLRTPLLGDLLELFSGISPGVQIWVIFFGQLEICGLDVFLGGICLDPQDLYRVR
jgi:hypothetical protein